MHLGHMGLACACALCCAEMTAGPVQWPRANAASTCQHQINHLSCRLGPLQVRSNFLHRSAVQQMMVGKDEVDGNWQIYMFAHSLAGGCRQA